tara:strand:- start:487 stop:765 length:279 start_codon:yes stop_codon:yes gene_type:complete
MNRDKRKGEKNKNRKEYRSKNLEHRKECRRGEKAEAKKETQRKNFLTFVMDDYIQGNIKWRHSIWQHRAGYYILIHISCKGVFVKVWFGDEL